ncbi:hypothetical protein Tco_0826642, partial [Tanacetum coccineum]
MFFGVDAMKLHEDYQVYLGKYELGDEHRKRWNEIKDDPQQNKKLDSAIMNFLYDEETYKSAERQLNKTDDHANLFGGSFKGLSRILDDLGEVIVRINAGLANDWDVDKLAALDLSW